jgi:hypothetical protein
LSASKVLLKTWLIGSLFSCLWLRSSRNQAIPSCDLPLPFGKLISLTPAEVAPVETFVKGQACVSLPCTEREKKKFADCGLKQIR